MLAKSKPKKLRIHSGSHFHPFHAEEARIDRLRWFDHWLKNNDTGIMDEPPVKLQIRTGGNLKGYPFRYENEWPLARTQWTKYHLHIEREASDKKDAIEGSLVASPAKTLSKATYPGAAATRPGKAPRGISFVTPPMEKDTEVTGPIVLKLWVSSTNEDMDIFATIRNIDADGKDVCEIGQQEDEIACVTKGWLRASHRKLDKEKSTPYRPYHAHDERQWLKDGEIVECDVEIWPTSMVFKKGHKIRLDIGPVDGIGSLYFSHFHADYNQGALNTVYSGGDKESYLLLPIIPPIVQRLCVEGSGAKVKCFSSAASRSTSSTMPGCTRANRCSKFSSTIRFRYFEKSRTMATLQAWPARLVPAPRARIGALNFRAMATVAMTSASVFGTTRPIGNWR